MWNSFLKFAFPSIWQLSSKYSTKQYISAQYCGKQMGEIWCKNIQAFLRYGNFRVGIFYFASPCIVFVLPVEIRQMVIQLSSLTRSVMLSVGCCVALACYLLNLVWDIPLDSLAANRWPGGTHNWWNTFKNLMDDAPAAEKCQAGRHWHFILCKQYGEVDDEVCQTAAEPSTTASCAKIWTNAVAWEVVLQWPGVYLHQAEWINQISVGLWPW